MTNYEKICFQKINFILVLFSIIVNIGTTQIQLLNDEFDNAQSLVNWKNINVEEKSSLKIKKS